MKILHLALCALLLLPAISQSADEPSATPPPNIIFINVDDLGWADLGCYGSKYYETLAIDRLAAQGVKFTDAYAAAAICSPTRAAMLSGRYPARLGLTDWLRADYQGGKIPADRKNPAGYEANEGKPLETPINAADSFMSVEVHIRAHQRRIKPRPHRLEPARIPLLNRRPQDRVLV